MEVFCSGHAVGGGAARRANSLEIQVAGREQTAGRSTGMEVTLDSWMERSVRREASGT